MPRLPEPRNIIYGLFALDEPHRIRYIGLTTQGLKTRLTQHLSDGEVRARLPVHLWIKKHGRASIGAIVLATAEDPAELPALEMALIAEHGGDRDELLNRTDGGEGPNGYVYTEEHREKQRQARIGFVNSEETLKRMSKSAFASWQNNEERREKVRKNAPHLNEVRGAAQAALAKLREDPEWERRLQEKRIASLRGNPASMRSMALSRSKLSEAEVLEIRRRADAGEGCVALGKAFDVSPSVASRIALRKSWKHLAEERVE